MTLPPVSMTKKRMMVMPISRMRNSAVTTQPSTALPNSLKIAATISVPQVKRLICDWVHELAQFGDLVIFAGHPTVGEAYRCRRR